MGAKITTARQAITVYFKDRPELLAQCDVAVARIGAAWNATQGGSPAVRFHSVMQVADQEIAARKRESRAVLPCKAGCHHCCVQEVLVSISEAVLLVQFIEHQMDGAQRAAAIHRIEASGVSGATASTPCAMLASDKTCSAYLNRPLACRSYLALSEPACRSYRDHRGQPPPVFRPAVVVDVAVREVARLYRHSGNYEVNTLLKRIYADPAKVALWAAEQPTDESDLARG